MSTSYATATPPPPPHSSFIADSDARAAASSAADIAITTSASSTISQLVQSHQAGVITKEQMIAALTTLRNDLTTLRNGAEDGIEEPVYQQQPQQQFYTSPDQHHHPHQEQQQQPSLPPHLPPFTSASASVSPVYYTPAEQEAAQYQIQAFLARHGRYPPVTKNGRVFHEAITMETPGFEIHHVEAVSSALSSLSAMNYSHQFAHASPIPSYSAAVAAHQQQPQLSYSHPSSYHSSFSEEPEEYFGDSHYGDVGFHSGEYLENNRNHRHQYASSSHAAPPSASPTSARQTVRQRQSSVYTAEKNAELTFHPSITPLPRDIYPEAAFSHDIKSLEPFLERTRNWQHAKRAREYYHALEAEAEELEECTFHPAISSASVAIVNGPGQDMRGLFSARSRARRRIIELEAQRREREVLEKTCTFQPELNETTRRLVSDERVMDRAFLSSQRSQQRIAQLAQIQAERVVSECTFHPSTTPLRRHSNGVDMKAVKMYLKQDPFERLSAAAGQIERRGGWDEKGYDSDFVSTRRTRRMEPYNGSHRRCGRSHSHGRASTTSHTRSSSANFNEFLARLHLDQQQRHHRAEQLALTIQYENQQGRPMLTKKSMEIVKKRQEEGEYVAPHQILYSSNGGGQTLSSSFASIPPPPAHCTFTPSINSYSSSLPRPSSSSMSQDESRRRDENLKHAIQARYTQQMADVTFTPVRIASPPPQYAALPSRLRILSEPDLYIQRLLFQKELRAADVRRMNELREKEEQSECTWRPQIKDAPIYVKRIAGKYQVKKQKEKEQEMKKRQNGSRKQKERPQWI